MILNKNLLIYLSILAILGSGITFSIARKRNRAAEVNLEEVTRKNLVETVTASGNIRAGRVVDISSDVSARVSALLVAEGDDVEVGQLLLRLDPIQFKAAVSRTNAARNQAIAQEHQQEASLERTRRDYERLLRIFKTDSVLVARQQLDDAKTEMELATHRLESLQFAVAQAEASLEEAQELLDKTIFTAPIPGKVTRLNVEEGETVIVGTMNNPGSLVLTISELSRVEAVVEVDETDIPYIEIGDSTVLELDAFPNQIFSGVVTKIGNSAIRPPASTAGSGQTAAIDFEVVITIDNPPGGIRPDLSATADIIIATRNNVLSIPIIALTVRPPEGSELDDNENSLSDNENTVGRELGPAGPQDTDIEGVFVVVDGEVIFTSVGIGITGQEDFEVLDGISEGDIVVAGPYQQIRELSDGDAVRAVESTDRNNGFRFNFRSN
jgi:HlyD family secretion protein